MIKHILCLAVLVGVQFVPQTVLAQTYTRGFISEEVRFAPATCDVGDVVAGFRCSGGYCDNVALRCRNTNFRLVNRSWTPFRSEEGGGRIRCGANN